MRSGNAPPTGSNRVLSQDQPHRRGRCCARRHRARRCTRRQPGPGADGQPGADKHDRLSQPAGGVPRSAPDRGTPLSYASRMPDPRARVALAEAVLRSLELTEREPGSYETVPPRTFGDRTFGGQVLAMATAAVMRAADAADPPHSLHGYFLRPVAPEVIVQLSVETVREGRSFRTFEVRIAQDDQTRFVATAQFHADEPGVDYQPTMPCVPPPAGLEEH